MSTNLVIPTKTVSQNVYGNWRMIKAAIDKYLYGYQEYCQYGMFYGDLYRNGHPDVAEAVRRLPEDVYTARVHRHHRAIQLSRNKIYLPEAMWTKQDDPMHKYMEPYLQEIYKENAEKAEWNKK